ncbi:MAG: Gfo/Idh/MocA family oxidoreductase [Clostridia bacterium]|nr:Gfo/Idh/MocA family oxidoreductase [Clostridia bacterium]
MKVAILGVWHVHAKDYANAALPLAEVIGFYEENDELAKEFMSMFDIPRFATAEELLESDADGVIVCSSTKDHTRDIISVANAKKNIFTEKILALTLEECEDIERAIKDNRVEFTISMPLKYRSNCLTVKKVVEGGELGKLNLVRYHKSHSGSVKGWLPAHFYNREQCGGGAMIDHGAHGMYLIHWLLGMPVCASSALTVATTSEDALEKNIDRVEDNSVTVMKFENGAIAINESSFVTKYSPMFFEIYGEDGYVCMDKDSVKKCSESTGGALVELELEEELPSPILQFLTGKKLEGCGIEDAKVLTRMMEMAYAEK